MNNHGLRNSIGLTIMRVLQAVTTFILFALIARFLGPHDFGTFTLAFSIYLVFVTIASQGLKVLFTRELSKFPDERALCLGTGTYIQLALSSAAFACLALFTFAMHYETQTSWLCLVMGLTIFPFSLSNVTESVFQADERMHIVSLLAAPIYLTRLGLTLFLVTRGTTILRVAVVFLAGETLLLLFEWFAILPTVKPIWNFDLRFAKKTIESGGTFVAIEAITVVREKLPILMLSAMAGETLVGLFGASQQLLQPFHILSSSLVLGVFPKVSRSGKKMKCTATEQVVAFSLAVALTIVLGALTFGGLVIHTVFRDPRFSAATAALNVIVFGTLCSSLSRPFSYLLAASGAERFNLREVVTTCAIGLPVGIVLIHKYGLRGAALGTLLMDACACAQYIMMVSKNGMDLSPTRILSAPFLTLTLMSGVFYVMRDYQNLSWILVVITISFVITFLLSHTLFQVRDCSKVGITLHD